jgi:hypothetical protein
MMNVTYGVTEEVYSLGSSSRTSYGIAAYVNVADVGTATVVTVIHDITSDRDALEALVFACNHLELSTIHLIDVVEDFIAN